MAASKSMFAPLSVTQVPAERHEIRHGHHPCVVCALRLVEHVQQPRMHGRLERGLIATPTRQEREHVVKGIERYFQAMRSCGQVARR